MFAFGLGYSARRIVRGPAIEAERHGALGRGG